MQLPAACRASQSRAIVTVTVMVMVIPPDRYASLQSHQNLELSRADDLWSVFYVFIEFYQGQLPWRKLKSKEDIGEMKKQYHNSSLVAGLPPVFFSFMEHLMSLQYKDTPDYDYLISLVRQLDPRADMQPYDWEGDAAVYRCVVAPASLAPL